MLKYTIVYSQNDRCGNAVVNGADECQDNSVLISSSSLGISHEFMLGRYGFELSSKEIWQFRAHYSIWQNFAVSGQAYCLIIDHKSKVSGPVEVMERSIHKSLKKYSDCDVLFPFQATTPELEKAEYGYLLGYKWGSESYFLTRSGVEKLLSINEIRQPLIDEMLWLSIEKKLNIYNKKMPYFRGETNDLVLKSRAESIKKAIFSVSTWGNEKPVAVDLLKLISEKAKCFNIELWLSYGSMLGCIRHGGIMPWDDDIDLSINEKDYSRFSDALKSSNKLDFDIFYFGVEKIPYCKIWLVEQPKIMGYTYSFPFVDIWFQNDTSKMVVFKDGMRYNKSVYYPGREMVFEKSLLKIPSKPLEYLDITYENWRTKIQVYSWSHRYETEQFHHLSLDIKVDENGRYIEEIVF
jgi:GR25 family glycosyltransferase involved in LPS biosynthesis